MKTTRTILAISAAALFCAAQTFGSTITNGFTYAVASSGGPDLTGSHFHSNTGGSFGNPAGKAEVGSYSVEEIRGLSEYSLAGLLGGPAFVTFDVYKAGGLFNGVNDFTFNGLIDVYSYQGNNTEDISDYQAPGTYIGSFSTGGLVVGSIISLDITTQFNSALTSSWSSLGMRLQRQGGSPDGAGAWTFDDFRLTTNNLSTVPDSGSVLALLGAAMLALAAVRRRVA